MYTKTHGQSALTGQPTRGKDEGLRAALYLARFLEAQGVPRIYGHPGTESIELIEAAREVGIDFVLTHHEATASFAASMTGRLTGIPGVCVTTAGPGATNVASGVAQAFLDRMPMMVVTGDHPMGPGHPRHQRLPPDLYAPIAKATYRMTAASLSGDLPDAFLTAGRHPRGPVYLTFPSDEMMVEVAHAQGGPDQVTLAEPQPMQGLAQAKAMLEAAVRPMIIAGLGVPAARAEHAFARFADHLHAPVADTPQGRGSIATDHPRYVGTFATHRDAEVAAVGNASDLIVTVGLDSVEFLKRWSLEPPVLVVSESAANDDGAIPAAHVVSGPLDEVLEELSTARRAGHWSLDELAQHLPVTDPPHAHGNGNQGRLLPQTVVAVMQDRAPADTIVTVDVGSHKLLMVRQWIVRSPGTFLNSSGISSMGTGIPFAMAARLVHPARPVLAVVGDGGFLMYAGELATIARLRAQLVVVVMADAALSSIKIKQVRRSYEPVGTEFEGVRVAEIASAFGIASERAASADALGHALRRGFRASEPVVIEALIDPAGYELTQ